MTSFLCAEGGPIWIKFRGVVQNDMSTAVRCGNGSEMYNSNMADVWANSMACYRGATYDIAGFCHLVNSLSRLQSQMLHCRVQSPDEINVVIMPHYRCKNSIRHIENLYGRIFNRLYLQRHKTA